VVASRARLSRRIRPSAAGFGLDFSSGAGAGYTSALSKATHGATRALAASGAHHKTIKGVIP
jgi:hypothetical protein